MTDLQNIEAVLLKLLETHDVIPLGRWCDEKCTDMHVDMPTLKHSAKKIAQLCSSRELAALNWVVDTIVADKTPNIRNARQAIIDRIIELEAALKKKEKYD